MSKPQYTQEEMQIIKEWGVPSDKKYDSIKLGWNGYTGKKLTSLSLALNRKKFMQKNSADMLNGRSNFKVVDTSIKD